MRIFTCLAAVLLLAGMNTRPPKTPQMPIPIIGARKLSQLQDNLASIDLKLSADQFKTLDEASQIELRFPYDFYAKELPRTFIYGGLRDQILA